MLRDSQAYGMVNRKIYANTDGILFKLRATNEDEADREFAIVDEICAEWEERTGMTLELDEFKRVVQRDVNNYIIVDPDGGYKSKGGEVKKLNNLDYDLAIVNRAMVNYFVKGVDPEETIRGCTQLRDFMKVYKLSSLYNYCEHNGERLEDKTFRVFASTRESDGALYKVKDKGERGLVPEKFAGCPNHCFIDNTNVQEKGLPEYLDVEWYVREAKRRIERFTKEKE